MPNSTRVLLPDPTTVLDTKLLVMAIAYQAAAFETIFPPWKMKGSPAMTASHMRIMLVSTYAIYVQYIAYIEYVYDCVHHGQLVELDPTAQDTYQLYQQVGGSRADAALRCRSSLWMCFNFKIYHYIY